MFAACVSFVDSGTTLWPAREAEHSIETPLSYNLHRSALTCRSVKSRLAAISILRGRHKYLLKWNSFSNSRSWVLVYAVRNRRGRPFSATNSAGKLQKWKFPLQLFLYLLNCIRFWGFVFFFLFQFQIKKRKNRRKMWKTKKRSCHVWMQSIIDYRFDGENICLNLFTWK